MPEDDEAKQQAAAAERDSERADGGDTPRAAETDGDFRPEDLDPSDLEAARAFLRGEAPADNQSHLSRLRDNQHGGGGGSSLAPFL